MRVQDKKDLAEGDIRMPLPNNCNLNNIRVKSMQIFKKIITAGILSPVDPLKDRPQVSSLPLDRHSDRSGCSA